MSEQLSRGISRRTLAKGATWAVPAVAVATATPAMAASPGPLTFTGLACKLPGNSSDIFKGFVIEMRANNVLGPNPLNAVTVITYVRVRDSVETNFAVKVVGGNPGDCTCFGACGGAPANQQFCTPDGVLNQQILVYTGNDLTGNSANSTFEIRYQRYECSGGACVAFDPAPVSISATIQSTPPTQEGGGGSCQVQNVFPLPAA